MENNINSYSILEIGKTDEQEVIKQGYKKMIKKYHPDKNKGIDTTTQFIKIQKAYEILSDPIQKREHDSRILIQEKKDKYTLNRKQMIKELVRKEKQSTKDTMTQKKRQRDDYESNQNTYYNTNTNNNQKGTIKLIDLLQVKMNKQKAFDFSKEILNAYFKDYGVIDEILICKDKSNKALVTDDYQALISFKFNLKIDQVIERTRNDKNLRQLFELKKKSMTLEKYNRRKRKYEGDDRNIGKRLYNKEEMNEIQSTINKEKMVNNILHNLNNNKGTKTNTNEAKQSQTNVNLNSITLEDFEKTVFG